MLLFEFRCLGVSSKQSEAASKNVMPNSLSCCVWAGLYPTQTQHDSEFGVNLFYLFYLGVTMAFKTDGVNNAPPQAHLRWGIILHFQFLYSGGMLGIMKALRHY